VQPTDPRFPFTQLDYRTRVEVLKLAKRRERHPDPAVAEAAREWANHKSWQNRLNRLPGWLQPCMSLVFVLFGLVVGVPLIVGLGLLAIVLGLVGWDVNRGARSVRTTYDESAS
jgi:hypothetical protein